MNVLEWLDLEVVSLPCSVPYSQAYKESMVSEEHSCDKLKQEWWYCLLYGKKINLYAPECLHTLT